ncbi:MAG: hypothetical protein K940chlam7_01236, partial [Chlamydiae bacterium]|nr:hypothetical protein [Chlamydiota bacterium]
MLIWMLCIENRWTLGAKMNKFVKDAKKMVVILAFLFPAVSVFANNECCSKKEPWVDSCYPCSYEPCYTCGFDIGIDFLWWKPCVDDLDYATEGVTASNFKVKHICPKWEPGVRIMFSKPDVFCGWDLNLSGSYIQSTDSASVSRDDSIIGNLLFVSEPTEEFEGFFDSAKGRWETDYFEWDVLFSYDMPFASCHSFKPFFGVTGLVLDQELKGKYI